MISILTWEWINRLNVKLKEVGLLLVLVPGPSRTPQEPLKLALSLILPDFLSTGIRRSEPQEPLQHVAPSQKHKPEPERPAAAPAHLGSDRPRPLVLAVRLQDQSCS